MLAAAIVAVGTSLATAPAPSSAAPLRVAWDAPSSCPSASVVRGRIDALLAGSDAGAGLEVQARAHRLEDQTWTVEVEISGEDGQRRRTIPGGLDCTEAAEAAAVVIAISIDPQAGAGRIPPPPSQAVPAPPPEAEPEPEPEPAAAQTEPEPAPSLVPSELPEADPGGSDSGGLSGSADAARRDPPGPPLRGLVGVFGGFGFGNLPTVAGTSGLEAGLALPRVRVTAAGQYWFRSAAIVPGATVDFRQWSVALRACPVFPVAARFELLACAGVEAGQTVVRAEGTDQAAPPNQPWIAWLVQPGVVLLPVPWLGLRASTELYGPFILASYRLAPAGEVFAPSPVGVRAVFAIEVRFP
ncbi:MAG: hypothetical protein AAF799_10730 [Myxococcota bacterium]